MEKQIDARGLDCPQPVILTKKALDEMEEGKVVTIVNSETARENVKKLADSLTCSVDVQQVGGDYYISIFKEKSLEGPKFENLAGKNGLVIVIGADTLGTGDTTLGRILMKAYLKTLAEVCPLPETIIFLNSGVNLSVEGSEALEALRELEGMGVEILSCGTCLDYYNVKDKLAVGQVSNMYTIAEKMNNGENTIFL
ncbi:MAG TPA: sulfurtransferase-like selenium metabolism protein YedF [Clostridia bacterium]|nr:sulfurtransferase-like selenium metabolism protein YedF [Clostridia bacterium]